MSRDNYANRLKNALMELDRVLTGKTLREVEHTAITSSRQFMNADNDSGVPDWLMSNEEYYLSDGGYSRVVWHFDWTTIWRGHLTLTSNSRREVVQAWENNLSIINQIEFRLNWMLGELQAKDKERRNAEDA